MEKTLKVRANDILTIKNELAFIKSLLLSQTVTLEDEFGKWELLSDQALENFEDSL